MIAAELIEAQKARIDSILAKKFEKRNAWPPPLAEAIRYSLFAGGKRLRPVLALTVVELLGRDFTRFDNLFVALECIHTYSLIHDDLPAMDNDDLRRGLPTSHKKFGEAAAILAGDGLLTFAFELLSEESFARNFQPENVTRCVHQVASAAGPGGMVGGQFIDTCGVVAPSTEDRLQNMHDLKTARLLSVSVTAPAVLAGVHEAILQKLAEYGDAIGLAFQVCDDILNVVGNQEYMGKAVGTDEKMGKWTYPKVLGLDGAAAKARELSAKARAALGSFPPDRRRPLELLAEFVVERVK
ncbi:MAG: hypothetical protein A3G34_08125 [Candidatus Lindowbacteria bacterium RIFCSPLOWO2_12_FULL_62_27]|nr:MAG: hypothetical protein A3G34_08125 [Candidatus Lindowbacteria bacterium RIFCSPLOWO2_12_FULL_62_27]OGH62338.1 MAG: hypothetical protein A3I06_00295 [Candidatus Lindowbacteria bacterium RIFCSPLOWO2_02_FULL_62_12]